MSGRSIWWIARGLFGDLKNGPGYLFYKRKPIRITGDARYRCDGWRGRKHRGTEDVCRTSSSAYISLMSPGFIMFPHTGPVRVEVRMKTL